MSYTPRRVCIHGIGLLGGSICLSLKASGFTGRIIGISSSASIAKALALGAIDEGAGYDCLADVARRADCIFLCSPISVIMKTIEDLGKISLPQGLVITDVGSTKGHINACAQRYLPDAVTFIGGHPMAGSEKNGIGASDPFLFQNAMYLLTPPLGRSGVTEEDFGAFLQRYLGCKTVQVDAEEHDAIVAAVSHVPHMLAVALVNLAGAVDQRRPGALRLAAGGFRDMTRIASSSYSIWRDILKTNKNAISPLLDDYIESLRNMQSALVDDGLEDCFNSAARIRGEIPVRAKGFISPHCDVLVVAEDQPGIIARLSAALAAENINIKEIEVLKVREGEAGCIRMGFASRETAAHAAAVLFSAGFTAQERE